MATTTSGEEVYLNRGGQRIQLYKSPNLIAVRLKDDVVPDNLPGRLIKELNLPTNVRYVKRYPGQRIGIFHVNEKDRDGVMVKLRSEKSESNKVVQYVSHVFQRSSAGDLPGSEIALDNKVFIEFPKPPQSEELLAIEKDQNLRAIWRFPENPCGVVFELTERATQNPIKISESLLASKKYKTVEPCLIEAKEGRAIPNDAGFRRQWHLLNNGQGGGQPGADCNAVEAWDYTWGSKDITIAVIDDGFDLDHPDFKIPGKIVAPYDATERDTDPNPSNFRENHGTSCAGVAAAGRGGGITVGVAPDCTLMPIRNAGRLGDYDEALAFYHAYKNNADVISCSWGPYDAYKNEVWPLPSLTRFVIDICTTRGRQGKGIPIFFAAGNGNEPLDLDGYANYPGVMAVAASTNEDEKAAYSDYGKNVWVIAPSSGGTLGIFTTDRIGPEGYDFQSDYTDEFGGTSSSCPLVAGVAALMLSANPELTLQDIRDILKNTADKINQDQVTTFQDYWGNRYDDAYDEEGHSKVYGWGRVNAGAAVAMAWQMKNANFSA